MNLRKLKDRLDFDSVDKGDFLLGIDNNGVTSFSIYGIYEELVRKGSNEYVKFEGSVFLPFAIIPQSINPTFLMDFYQNFHNAESTKLIFNPKSNLEYYSIKL